MNNAPPFRRMLVMCMLPGAIAVTSCGSPQQASPNSAPPAAHTDLSRGADQPVDLSEVPQPADVVGLVRVASVRQLVERVGQISGMSEPLRAMVDSTLEDLIGGVSPAIDRDAPFDVIAVAEPAIRTRAPVAGSPAPTNADLQVALSFGGPSMDEIERALGQTHRLIAFANGARRLERIAPAANGSSAPAHVASSHQQCVVAPTPDPVHTRIVCADHAGLLEEITPFAARTLTRRAPTPDAVTLDVFLDTLRRSYTQDDDALASLETARRQLDTALSQSVLITDTNVRHAVSELAREGVDAARGLLADPTTANVTVTVAPDRVSLHFGIDMRPPTSVLLRALAEASRDQPPVPPSLLTHLLPGGWSYATATFDFRPFRSLMTMTSTIGTLMVDHEPGLDNGDRAALRAVLDAIPNGLDQFAEALALGSDDHGVMWATAAMHASTLPATQWIATMRAGLAAMRRPHIASILHELAHHGHADFPDLGDLRELPVRGLPAGSISVRLPSMDALRAAATAGAAHAPPVAPAPHTPHAAHPQHTPPLELLIVPDGNDAVLVIGAHARDLYNRYRANTTQGIQTAAVTSPSSTMVEAFVMAGMPNMLRATSEHDAAEFARTLARFADHGTTPISLRMDSAEINGLQRYSMDVEMQQATLRDYIGAITHPGGAGAGSPAPPQSP